MTAPKKIEAPKHNPTTVRLYRLYEIASTLGASPSKLMQWDKDPETSTPAPAFVVGDVDHWTDESLPAWKALVDQETDRIANKGYTLAEMTDKVKTYAERVDRKATYAKSRDRSGYSKTTVAKQVAEVEAIVGFLESLSESGYLEPRETSREIKKMIASAKSKLESK